MKGWFLGPVLMIIGGLALYTELPGNELAAAAVFLGSVIFLALLVWYLTEELQVDLEELRDGLAGLFHRRPREVEVLELGGQLISLRNTIIEVSIASCEVQRLQLAELKELVYHASWIGALLGEMLDEGCFVKPVDTEIAMSEAGRNLGTALSHAVQKSLQEREVRRVLALSSVGRTFSEWMERLRDAGLSSRYTSRLDYEALISGALSLPDDPGDLLGWLEGIAMGRVPVRSFGEKGQAALLEALKIAALAPAGDSPVEEQCA